MIALIAMQSLHVCGGEFRFWLANTLELSRTHRRRPKDRRGKIPDREISALDLAWKAEYVPTGKRAAGAGTPTLRQ